MARTIGVRFLEEFQRVGGSISDWTPQAVEALKNADRRAFSDALGKVSSESAKILTIAAHTAEPETLARRAAALARKDNAADDLWLLMLPLLAAQ